MLKLAFKRTINKLKRNFGKDSIHAYRPIRFNYVMIYLFCNRFSDKYVFNDFLLKAFLGTLIVFGFYEYLDNKGKMTGGVNLAISFLSFAVMRYTELITDMQSFFYSVISTAAIYIAGAFVVVFLLTFIDEFFRIYKYKNAS